MIASLKLARNTVHHAGDDPIASPLQRHPWPPGESVPSSLPDHQVPGDRTSPYHGGSVRRRYPFGSTRAAPRARVTPGRRRVTPRPRREPYTVVASRLLLGNAEAAAKTWKAATAGHATASRAHATGRARSRIRITVRVRARARMSHLGRRGSGTRLRIKWRFGFKLSHGRAHEIAARSFMHRDDGIQITTGCPCQRTDSHPTAKRLLLVEETRPVESTVIVPGNNA